MSLISLSEKSNKTIDTSFHANQFILNNIDSYFGTYLVNTLKKLVPPKPEYNPPSIHGEEEVIYREPTPPPPYEILGTIKDEKTAEVKGVQIISEEQFLDIAPNCGYVIINIGDDEESLVLATKYIDKMTKILEDSPDLEISGHVRHFILLSTPMTWAKTKPVEVGVPLTEADFRKRKAHPNYKKHYNVENDTLKLARNFKNKIKALVLVPGIKYGGKEDILHYWFQQAWENQITLPVIGKGFNSVPLIYVHDLANIIAFFIQNFPKKLYLLAVEENATSEREIIKYLSREIGRGTYKSIAKEKALEIKGMTEKNADYMSTNVTLEPTYISENVDIDWTNYWKIDNFQEKVASLFKEFVRENKLKPFRIILHGPPGVGKSILAKQICDNYGLTYVSKETIIEDTINELTRRLEEYYFLVGKRMVGEEVLEEETDEVDEVDEDPDDWDELISEVKNELKFLKSGTANDEEEILSYIRKKLLTNVCLNVGWVLDDYPNLVSQCADLFEKGAEVDDDVSETEEDLFEEDVGFLDPYLKKILPTVVITLTAGDEYIIRKFMNLPECDIRNTKFEEPVLLQRLADFRSNDKNDNTVLNFFDEIDIHPIVMNAEKDDYALTKCYREVRSLLGDPSSFGAVLEKLEANEASKFEEIENLRKREQLERDELQNRLLKEREDKMLHWSELMKLVNKEEEAIMEAQSESLRNYMMKYVLPTLSSGLLELSKLRPQDPVDFLAEYLLKQNPTGHLVDPGYNLQCEALLNQMEVIDMDLLKMEIVKPETIEID